VYFLLAAFVVMFIQLYIPNPINWNRNFNTQSKDPYGLYVFNQELSHLLKDQKLVKTSLTPYEYFLDKEQTTESKTTYLFVENKSGLDDVFVQQVLKKVRNGADLVIASENFYYGNSYILDTLNIHLHNIKTNNLNFVNKGSSADTLKIKDEYNNIFTVKNPENYTAIAKLNNNISFISTKFGKGTVYISSSPILLTNFYILNNEEKSSIFTEEFVSFIKKENVVWFDENYNIGERESNNSILNVIFKHKSLRFAWYTLIIGLLLYVIFYGKRKQRIVPVIDPVKNTTVEYIETVGNLYYQENNHTQLLDKQIKFALYFIRTEWKIITQDLNQDFKTKLQQKSLANTADIDQFVNFITNFNIDTKYSQADLIQFNQLLEKLHINYGKSRK